MNIGIFAIDPGVHTGTAWAIVDPTQRLVADAMTNRTSWGTGMLEGDPMSQARELWKNWEWFKRHCHLTAQLPLDNIFLVSEDFVLRPGQHAGGKDGTAPERVIWAFEGYRNGRMDAPARIRRHFTSITWQQPGQAARYKKRPVLEACDAWVRGTKADHERSAMSHMILFLMGRMAASSLDAA